MSTPSFAVEQSSPVRSARQAEVFERLIALTLDRGFAGYTLEQAAIALRCSKSTIYALAGSREQLIRAVVVAFFRSAAERVEERVAAESDPVRRIQVYLLAVADELRRRFRLKETLNFRGVHYSKPAPLETIEDMARKCDIVVCALGG